MPQVKEIEWKLAFYTIKIDLIVGCFLIRKSQPLKFLDSIIYSLCNSGLNFALSWLMALNFAFEVWGKSRGNYLSFS